MKRIILLSFAFAALTSCGGNDSKEKDNKEEKKTEDSGLSANPDYQKGLALVGKSNCLTCHKIDEPLTGPPYREVANK